MTIPDRKALASQILSEVERDIKTLNMQIEVMQEELHNLESQRDAAQVLAGVKRSPSVSDASNGNGSSVQIIRAKNVPDLVYQFLRDQCPNGETAMQLHDKINATGASIGSRTYIYKILSDLTSAGKAFKDKNGKFRAKSSAEAPEWESHPQVTQ